MLFNSNMLKEVAKITVGFIALTILLSSCRETEVKELEPEQIVEYSKPGTVLVEANHKVEYTFPEPVLDDGKLEGLFEVTKKKFTRGEISSQEEGIVFILRETFGNPLDYFSPGKKIDSKAEVPTTGTGFFVTSAGTIATAAHVVSNQNPEIKRELIKNSLRELTTKTCEGAIKGIASSTASSALNRRISQDEFMNLCLNGFTEYYLKYLELSDVQTSTSVVMQPPNPEQQGTLKRIPSQIETVGKLTPADDVALLKVEGNNLPVMALASNHVNTGNEVYFLGYPGAVTQTITALKNIEEGSQRTSTNLPQPTLTTGRVSAAEQTVEGGQVIQANISISPGSSGGPLFDKKGEVVGIASFVSVDEDGGQVQGASFFVPVEVLKRKLQSESITMQPSEINKRYQQAVEHFNQKHYRKSLQLFREVHDMNSEFPYIQQQISRAQTESAN